MYKKKTRNMSLGLKARTDTNETVSQITTNPTEKIFCVNTENGEPSFVQISYILHFFKKK